MDTKRLIPLMIVVMAVAIGWQYFIGYLYKINPQWKQPGQEIAATQPAEVSQPGQTTSPTGTPTLQVGTTFPSTLPSTLPVGTFRCLPRLSRRPACRWGKPMSKRPFRPPVLRSVPCSPTIRLFRWA